MPADLLHETRLVGREGRQRQAKDQIGDVLRPVLSDRQQQQAEGSASVVVEAAEQAEVEQDQPPVVAEQDVSAVRVGVVDAVHSHLVDVGAEELARELARPLRRKLVVTGQLLPLEELEDEHALADVRPDDLRYDEVLVVRDEGRDQLGVVRFLDEVELGAEVRLELVRERVQLEQPRRLRVALGERGRRAQQREVELHLLEDAGPPDLDHDLAPGREECSMDLGDRRCGQRLGIDVGEHVGAEIGLDDGRDVCERHRGHLVDELAELLDVDVRQEVRPGGEQLPELDVGRPELLERQAELACALGSRRPLAADDADLAKHAEETPAPCDASHLERSAHAASPCAH
jgi:hypothetical protein